jgi:FkbM family methyltransferase
MPTDVISYSKTLIYDIGAHEGEDTEFYLKKGFHVVAIEAAPELNIHLQNNFKKEIEGGQLTLLNCAISDVGGQIDFFVNEKLSIWGTANAKWAERNLKMGAPSRKIKVKAEQLENILGRYGMPYYMKIDIEGSDMLCLYALRKFPRRPDYLSIESEKISWKNLLNEFHVLKELGYKKFKVVNQGRVSSQIEPYPCFEGTYASHSFKSGSSGLFGKDLPGKWLTMNQAINRYRLIFVLYKFVGNTRTGQKIVSMIPFIRRFLIPHWYDTHASLH